MPRPAAETMARQKNPKPSPCPTLSPLPILNSGVKALSEVRRPPDRRNGVQGSSCTAAILFAHVRFGSKADIDERLADVRFAPESGHWSLYSITLVGLEHLTADGDRLRRYHCEGDDARHRAVVHPVMEGAPLHQHVTSLEVHTGAVKLHVDLA